MVSGKQSVSITASEKDAAIYVDNAYVGHGQATTLLSKGKTHTITAIKGNRFASAPINYSISTTGILDAAGGILLLPALGFLSDGAWQLDTAQVYLQMP